MFKLPLQFSNLNDSAEEWADYAEFTAIVDGPSINLFDLTKNSRLISDEEIVEGIDDATDDYIEKIDEIATELRLRLARSGNRYPFSLGDKDYILNYDKAHQTSEIYTYLLLATRANMGSHRHQASLDGALLFENLCSAIALNYFGARAKVDTLGTSRTDESSFRGKLAIITDKLGEGGAIHQNLGFQPQDDKVDLVVWKGFSDKNPSQMLAFGQCKTGTSWIKSLSELDTEAFCKKWFTRQPIITPLRMFFSAQYFPKQQFYVRAAEAGLVFDRFRILDYLPEISDELMNDLVLWTDAILQYYGVTENSRIA